VKGTDKEKEFKRDTLGSFFYFLQKISLITMLCIIILYLTRKNFFSNDI